MTDFWGKAKKLIKSNEGFSLIELITVIGVCSILGIVALPRFLEVIQKAEKVIAANSILNIKIECESNNSLGRELIFTPSILIGYDCLLYTSPSPRDNR